MFRDNGNEYVVKDSYNKLGIVLPQTEYSINFKCDGISTRKKCYIIAEKNQQDLIQLRITEKDFRNMYISNINTEFFDDLKLNQSLHVTYSGFVENLLKLLKDCQRNTLQMSLVQNKNNNDVSLQFYEIQSFKNLTHLSLPFEKASIEMVNFHLCRMVDSLQKHKQTFENIIQDLKRDSKNTYEEIAQLKKNNTKLLEDLFEQKQNFLKRRKQELEEMQEKIKVLTDSKEFDETQHKKTIQQLQSRIDLMNMERTNALKDKGTDAKKYETIRKENSTLKTTITNMKKASEKLSQEIVAFQNHEQQYNIEIANLNRKINENNERISKLHKTKSELEAELEAEKKLCQAKRNALIISTEEISKANEIIAKQSLEITKHKKTIDWRTEVALQQELTITEKEKTISNQNQKIGNMQQELHTLRKETLEFPTKLKSIQLLTDSIENKYSKQIADLKKHMKM